MDEIEYWRSAKSFVEETRGAASLHALAELFWKKIKPMGCKHFVCASSVDPLNPPPHAILLTNYPMSWAEWHSEQHYYKIDPVLKSAEKLLTSFKWSDESWRALLTFEQGNILNEASEVGISEGITFPIHSSIGYPASVSVVFEKGELNEDAILSLELMSMYLYESALSLKVKRSELFLKTLTEKERAVLQEIANGKTNWETSQILGTSENTVSTHVKNLMLKLNVHTRSQAVAKALFKGEVGFQDLQVSNSANDQALSNENVIIIQS